MRILWRHWKLSVIERCLYGEVQRISMRNCILNVPSTCIINYAIFNRPIMACIQIHAYRWRPRTKILALFFADGLCNQKFSFILHRQT